MSASALRPRELAYCGVFGAAALLLPVLFHLLQLGRVFMPMYLPLVALAFYVRPLPAALTAALVPLLSALVTGMPPLFPPVALSMALELAAMAAALAAGRQLWPRLPSLALLIPVLLAGRGLSFALAYLFWWAMDLPAEVAAGISLLSGWPGLLLILVTIPALLCATRREPQPRTQEPSA